VGWPSVWRVTAVLAISMSSRTRTRTRFGETALADSPNPTDTKAERLAERVAEARTLLLLDGVEPLQYPRHAGGLAGWRAGGLAGRLKDRGLERLLKRLAQLPGAGGLCVLTSRLALVPHFT